LQLTDKMPAVRDWRDCPNFSCLWSSLLITVFAKIPRTKVEQVKNQLGRVILSDHDEFDALGITVRSGRRSSNSLLGISQTFR
jgi:hypothetical protein